MIMANKRGKKNNIFMRSMAIIGSIAVVGAGVVGGLWVYNNNVQQTSFGDDIANEIANSNCNLAPTLQISVKDELQQGTAISADAKYLIDGEYFASAPSSFKAGSEVQVLLNASSYIDVLADPIVMGCGVNQVSETMFDFSAPAVEVKEDSTVLTDSATGGANNGSAVASGGSQTFSYVLTGNNKDSTGNMILVMELGTNQNVSTVTMYDGSRELQEVDVPSFYTDTLSSPYTVAFEVPAVVGAIEKDYKVTMVAKDGKTISGAVYTTAYVGEPFVEDDGSFVEFGVEKEDGTTTYEAEFDYDFFME